MSRLTLSQGEKNQYFSFVEKNYLEKFIVQFLKHFMVHNFFQLFSSKIQILGTKN